MPPESKIASLLVLSDLHINSTVAVCPPSVNLDDGGTYHASRTQVWLWRCLEEIAAEFARATGDKIVLFNGDLGELDTKRRTYQLITPNKATILDLVRDTIEPVTSIADRNYMLRGTPAHQGKSAWLEEAIADDLDHAVRSSKAAASWWHYRGTLAGVRIDSAHHVSMGGLPWTEKQAATKAASRIVWRYLVDMHQPPPSVAFRSHNHRWSDSYDNYPTRVICTPCLTTATEYIYRTGHENDLADIGALIMTCKDGEYEIQKLRFEPREARRVWTLTM